MGPELLSVVRPPSIGVLIHCGDVASVSALVPHLLFELSRRARLPAAGIHWPHPIGDLASVPSDLRVTLLQCRAARFHCGAALLDLGDEVVRLDTLQPAASARIEVTHPFPAVTPGIALALHDGSPLAMNEAHPDKSGNAVDLGAAEPDEWIASLRTALDLIGDTLPDLRAELELIVQQVVPVGQDGERHLSASFKEAVGSIYLTLHPSQLTMAEALIHESQHNKLNALLHLDPVLEDAFEPRFSSPVRPDPRPLHGVLLAVHAFLPVAELYLRLAATGHPIAASRAFRARLEQIVAGNEQGLATLLEHGAPTAKGRELLREMRGIAERHGAQAGG